MSSFVSFSSLSSMPFIRRTSIFDSHKTIPSQRFSPAMPHTLHSIILVILVMIRKAEPMPSSNSIRFKAIGLPQPLERWESSGFRRLLQEETNSSTLLSLAEFGVARKFGKGFDERFAGAHEQPNLKRAANASVEACARMCVETLSCRSWYLDEASVCFLYYMTVRGHPLGSAVSGDYDPPPVVIKSGSVTTEGGYACVCGERGSIEKVVTVATRKSIIGHVNTSFQSSDSFAASIDSVQLENLTLPTISAPHASILDNSMGVSTVSAADNNSRYLDIYPQETFTSNGAFAAQVRVVREEVVQYMGMFELTLRGGSTIPNPITLPAHFPMIPIEKMCFR